MATHNIAIDTETTGLDFWADMLAVSYAADGCTPKAVNVGFRDLFTTPAGVPQEKIKLRRLVRDARWVFMHNASFDIPLLVRDGWLTPGDLQNKVIDTMSLLPAVRAVDKRSLTYAARVYGVPIPSWIGGMKSKRGHLAEMPFDTVARYAKEDARITLDLGNVMLKDALSLYSEEWLEREGNFVLSVAMMTVYGIPVDEEALSRMLSEKRHAFADGVITLMREGIRGPNDKTGIVRALEREGTPIRELTETGQAKTDRATLQELEREGSMLVGGVLSVRRTEKQLTTWVTPMLEHSRRDGKVHARWKAGGTRSFRLTSTLPNMLAIPKEFRVFKPGDDYDSLLDLDLSQAELRLGGALAGSENFARLFAAGVDFHQATADVLFPDGVVPGDPDANARTIAKRANFGALYSGGANALVEATGVAYEVAEKVVREHRAAFPKVRRIGKDCEVVWSMRDNKIPGYLLLQPTGKRIYPTPRDHAGNRLYQAFNQLVQGSVAAVMQEVTLDVISEYPSSPIIGQVYDSLLLGIRDEDPDRVAAFIEESFNYRLQHVLTRTDPPIRMTVDYDIIT